MSTSAGDDNSVVTVEFFVNDETTTSKLKVKLDVENSLVISPISLE